MIKSPDIIIFESSKYVIRFLNTNVYGGHFVDLNRTHVHFRYTALYMYINIYCISPPPQHHQQVLFFIHFDFHQFINQPEYLCTIYLLTYIV